MSELRWHPLLRQWVAVATHRQQRPQLPDNWCPFCPGSGRVPANYDVHLYPNDFPAFALDADPFDPGAAGLFQKTGARGACDVVLYHPDHNTLPSELPAAQWSKVIELWTRRTAELFAIPEIEYVYVFENTGVAIGVTMPHPHGQIYAFPFVPPLVKAELDSARAGEGDCLYCRILAGEIGDGRRIVAENAGFVAFVPFFARWPSEVQIYSRRHFGALPDLAGGERAELAALIRTVRRKYDRLYAELQPPLPLMMIVRQRPARGEHACFHFHVEFYPIQRSAAKLKYLASVESGAGTFLADTSPEQQAEALRGVPAG